MRKETKQPVSIVPVRNEGELFQALAIREVVFIEEQHVPEGIERDAEDSEAYHVLAVEGGHAVGTGRLVVLEQPPSGQLGTWARVGRMAVLSAHRKSGVGSMLLRALEEEAARRKVTGILLHAQVESAEFYKRHGYSVFGPIFEEANMPHVAMKKQLLAS